MITYEQFVKALDTVQKYRDQINKEIHTVSHLVNSTRVCQLDLSVRLMNGLSRHYQILFPQREHFKDVLLSDLHGLSIKRLIGLKDIGAKSVYELKTLMDEYNLTYYS